MSESLAVIFGCASTVLSPDEKIFFKDANPLGFILFGRNVENPEQLSKLVSDLRECTGNPQAPILIDQEGGQVQRIKQPLWRHVPAPGIFASLHDYDAEAGLEAVRLNARLIASDLYDLGINVNCLPCLDLPQPDSHDFLLRRVSGRTPEQAITLGQATGEALLAGGVMPVIKHIPGHGRSKVDSHHDLPRISTSLAELQDYDFKPFIQLRSMGWGMTCHLVYEAIDDANPASTSKVVTQEIIRDYIGFDGFLVSDDIGMNALSGTVAERASACLAAGSDAVLQCNGIMEDMVSVAKTSPILRPNSRKRYDASLAKFQTPEAFDKAEALERVNELLAKVPESI